MFAKLTHAIIIKNVGELLKTVHCYHKNGNNVNHTEAPHSVGVWSLKISFIYKNTSCINILTVPYTNHDAL